MKHFKPTPVTLFILSFALGITATVCVPLLIHDYLPPQLGHIIGTSMLLLSAVVTLAAYRSFKTGHTPYHPYSRPKTLITTGVYALSRNPIYLSLVTAHAALGLISGSLWLIVSALVLLLMLDRTVVADEEEILKHRFPRSYPSYRSKTRRWL